jgi:hypothetical protein
MTPGGYMDPYNGPNVGIMMGDEVYSPPSANIKIINNISYGNYRNFFWWKGDRGRLNNVLIANNTFVNSTQFGGIVINEGDHQNVRFENNIVVQQDASIEVAVVAPNPELSFSNNLWSHSPDKDASGPGDVVGDPMFAKTGQPYAPEWFKLTSSSLAINRAKSILEVVDDYFGMVRAAPPDIGAIEYDGTGN